MSSKQVWALIAGILLINLVLVGGLVMILQSSVQRTLAPVESMGGELSTRVSEFLNPTPTILPSSVAVLREVRNLARLETIQFSIEKVITAETGQGIFASLLGDRLLFVGHGVVVAGIDLVKLRPDDIEVQDGILTIRLPDPEIFIATLDNEKSYVYNRETGLLTKGDINLETSARRAAEVEIENTALEDGILTIARQNAENYLYRLITELGYSEVIFIQPTPEPQE